MEDDSNTGGPGPFGSPQPSYTPPAFTREVEIVDVDTPLDVAEHPIRLEVTHGVLAGDQRANRELGLHLDRHAVQVALPVSGQEQGSRKKTARKSSRKTRKK